MCPFDAVQRFQPPGTRLSDAGGGVEVQLPLLGHVAGLLHLHRWWDDLILRLLCAIVDIEICERETEGCE